MQTFSGIFRGARVASNMADMVAVSFVERDDFVGGGEETSSGFVFDEYGVSISAEEVFEEEEAVESPDGCWADHALIVDRDTGSGVGGVDAVAKSCGELVSLAQFTSCAVDGLEDLVDVTGSEVRRNAGLCSVED